MGINFDYSNNITFFSMESERADRNRWSGFLLNLIIGFGSGSFVQGDIKGGLIGLFGELGSGIIYSLSFIPVETEYAVNGKNRSDGTYWVTEYPMAKIATPVGIAMLIGFRLFEMIRPFVYSDNLYFNYSPIISNNSLKHTLSINFRF